MALNIRPLTQEQRQSARQAAREAVLRAIGSKPIREQFAGETISKYPVSMTRMITLLQQQVSAARQVGALAHPGQKCYQGVVLCPVE